MAMSCEADKNASAAAAPIVQPGAPPASDSASATQASASSGWITSNQPRRRPNRPNGPG